MILDALLQFDAAFNLAQAIGTYNSTNIIDLHILAPPGVPILTAGQGARDMGIGDDPALTLLVQVTTAMVGVGATLQVALQGAPDNGSGAPGAFTTWWQSPAYAVGVLGAGARLYDMDMPRPPAGIPVPRFLRMSYAIAGAAGTAGTIQSMIVLDRMDQMYNVNANNVMGGYPSGVVVQN
jgi:hypothetical protein